MPEVASASDAADAYENAIEKLGGADEYYDCGDEMADNGIEGVAECMKGLPRKEVDESDWADKYKEKYSK